LFVLAFDEPAAFASAQRLRCGRRDGKLVTNDREICGLVVRLEDSLNHP
jgi:hypothetical protein